jgi:hypothetical protein
VLAVALVLADFGLAYLASEVYSAGQIADPDAPVCFRRAFQAGLVLADFGPVGSASQACAVGLPVDPASA